MGAGEWSGPNRGNKVFHSCGMVVGFVRSGQSSFQGRPHRKQKRKKVGTKRKKSVAPRLLGAGRANGYPDVAEFSCGSARARIFSLRHLLPLAIIK